MSKRIMEQLTQVLSIVSLIISLYVLSSARKANERHLRQIGEVHSMIEEAQKSVEEMRAQLESLRSKFAGMPSHPVSDGGDSESFGPSKMNDEEEPPDEEEDEQAEESTAESDGH